MVDFVKRFHNLIFRLVLSVVIIVFYVVDGESLTYNLNEVFSFNVMTLVWLVFILEILYRFFPTDNVGISKVYKKNYIEKPYNPTMLHEAKKHDVYGALIMFGLLVVMMAAVTTLYLTHIIDKGIVLIIVLALWVLSEICVELFCPFSYLFFKKKCCNKCRFYSWDYFLMFCPLIFIGSVFTYIIVLFAFALLMFWEVVYIKYPQRFYDISNESLACTSCTNKNCKYKNKLNSIADKIFSFVGRRGSK
ncbi:MAG: hypothetical protein J6V40_00660 [Clostridia bacterium]|nr:hypothetical protein [Clostridia bacterium]